MGMIPIYMAGDGSRWLVREHAPPMRLVIIPITAADCTPNTADTGPGPRQAPRPSDERAKGGQ